MIPHPESAAALLENIAPIVAKAQTDWKQTAPGFRSFALFDPKETVQTRIIAGLLDPSGNHGQGEAFLKLFLEAIGEDHDIKRLEFTRIDTEVMTKCIIDDRRRIDLLISLPTGRQIAVESKAHGAKDQPNQIPAYLAYLEKVAPSHVLLYLSRNEKKPDDVEEKKWKEWTEGPIPRVRPRNYDALIGQWLKSCEEFCSRERKAPALLTFLKEFSEFSSSVDERSPLMSKETIKTVADTILMSRERLIGSVMIQNSRETVRKRLANRFLSALKRQLDTMPNEGWQCELMPEDEGYCILAVRFPHWKTFRAVFQIGPVDNRDDDNPIGIGVQGGGLNTPAQEKQCGERIREPLKGALPRGHPTLRWACYQPEFGKDMSDESVACLLYEPPPEELQRLAKLLTSIIQAVRRPVDAFEKGALATG